MEAPSPEGVPPPEKSPREVVPAPLKPSEPGASLGFEEGMTVSVLIWMTRHRKRRRRWR